MFKRKLFVVTAILAVLVSSMVLQPAVALQQQTSRDLGRAQLGPRPSCCVAHGNNVEAD